MLDHELKGNHNLVDTSLVKETWIRPTVCVKLQYIWKFGSVLVPPLPFPHTYMERLEHKRQTTLSFYVRAWKAYCKELSSKFPLG